MRFDDRRGKKRSRWKFNESLDNPVGRATGSNARDFFHATSLSYLFQVHRVIFHRSARNVRVINRGNINNQPRRR